MLYNVDNQAKLGILTELAYGNMEPQAQVKKPQFHRTTPRHTLSVQFDLDGNMLNVWSLRSPDISAANLPISTAICCRPDTRNKHAPPNRHLAGPISRCQGDSGRAKRRDIPQSILTLSGTSSWGRCGLRSTLACLSQDYPETMAMLYDTSQFSFTPMPSNLSPLPD